MPMSEHLSQLRAKIGNDLLLVPAAGVAVFDDRGRLLLGRHVDTDTWATIGGMVEPGESPERAALRELAEETGFECEIRGLIGAYGGPDFQVTYPNGDRTAYVVTMYAARFTGGALRLEEAEIAEIGWFTSDTARELPMKPDMQHITPDAFRWRAPLGASI